MANVFIVEDHPVARFAIRMLLINEGHKIIGETDDGMKALRVTNNTEPPPELIILDLDIPTLSGVEVLERIRNRGFFGGILILTASDEEHYQKRCILGGANAFVSKRHNLDNVITAIKAIENGYVYFPHIRKDDMKYFYNKNESDVISELTIQELTILQELIKGARAVDISKKMNLSTKTISTYKHRIMKKLNVDSTVGLIDFWRRNKLTV